MAGGGSVIDTCVHHAWVREADVHPYLEPGWRAYVGKANSLPGGAGAKPLTTTRRYENPRGDYLKAAYADTTMPPGSSYDQLAEHLDAQGVGRALLQFDGALLAPVMPNPFLATPVVRAINDWNISEWLSRDERLYGVALIPVQVPQDAAAEIRRVGQNPKIAGVVMGAGLGKLFGHPLYYPIWEAATEFDLPVILHRGLDAIPETESSSGPAGGPPLTFAEYDTIAPVALMSQLMSLMNTGVFTRYPTLRICIVGAGVSWVPGWVRRMDLIWRALRREVPWMRKSPAEYIRENVRISTYGLERDSRGKLERFLQVHPDLREAICYGSGYPSWDTASVADIETIFPADWHDDVLRANAQKWFRWSSAADRSTEPAASRA